MPFAYYTIFGYPKKEYTSEEAKKAWNDFKTALKQNNLDLMGFGGAVGAQEQSVCMIRGNVTDYEAMLGSEGWQKMPMMNTRTVLVYKPVWA